MVTAAIYSVVCSMAFAGSVPPAWGAEPKWPKEPYRYLVIDQDLRDVIAEFGRNMKIPVRISESVTRRRIRNDVAVSSPRDFLQRLCESYGLVWYFDGAVLYVSDESEVQTEQIGTGSIDPQTLISELDALGGADPRFPIRAAGERRLIAVSGPPPYRAFVRQTLNAMEHSSGSRPGQNPVQEIINGDSPKVRVFKGTRQGS
jgi:type II secretory pathway component GspD/PulD (secretin)